VETRHGAVAEVPGDDHFSAKVLTLSGQSALFLGWRPDDFWNATPAELATVLQAFRPSIEAGADGDVLKTLMELFPDG
jgi:hypothetical protein